MSDILVEFTAPGSGAYIFESTDQIDLQFTDVDGGKYRLRVSVQPFGSSEEVHRAVNIDLKYPDEEELTLESVTIARHPD